jgi:CyaY protein
MIFHLLSHLALKRIMTESEFRNLADAAIETIQDAIDAIGADIDYEESGGVLTLTFNNRSKIIFSKQPPVKQLWMAAKSGGFHFDYDEASECWVCDSGAHEELFVMLSRLASNQGGETLVLSAS